MADYKSFPRPGPESGHLGLASGVIMSSVVITGAAGNLGTKLSSHFAQLGCNLTLLDMRPRGRPDIIEADLCEPGGSWTQHIHAANVVIHLAGATWPYQDWSDLQRSNIDALINVLNCCVDDRAPRRLVFASSLLTMDGYRNSTDIISPDMPARPTTFYAVTKLAGERLCLDATRRGPLDVVCLRLGATRRGANAPTSKVGLWEQQRWLSNGDFCRAIERAAFAQTRGFALALIASRNQGMRWSLEEARSLIGYEPADASVPKNPPVRHRLSRFARDHILTVWPGLQTHVH
jgi:NAD-dependent epimerase/dehydratase family protein